jgi:DNA-directed RNA polymerase subunit M/transcription elongation factor TFIIS
MKSCKKCGEIFTPYRTTDKHCFVCAKTEQALKNLAKIKKDKVKKAKEDLLTVSDYLKLAQQVFNKWIRLRDKGENCISCGKEINGVKHASHYLSSGGHSSVRFHPDNVWVSCYKCNVMLSGNGIEYRMRLIKKIGVDRVEWLEENGHEVKRWTKDELKELIALYKKKIKDSVY